MKLRLLWLAAAGLLGSFSTPRLHAQAAVGSTGSNVACNDVNGNPISKCGSTAAPISAALLGTVLSSGTSAIAITQATALTAIGDSITCGYTLADGNCPVGSTSTTPSPHAWPTVVGSSLGYTVNDYAVTRDEMADVWAHEIYGHGVQSHLTSNPLYAMLIGTNSADFTEDPGYFKLFHQAVLAWLATPRENLVLPGDAAMTGAGSWSAAADTTGTDITFGGAYDNSASGGGSLTVALTTYGSPVYIWYTVNSAIQGNSAYTFTASIDGGAATGPYSTGPSVATFTQNGTTASVALARIPVAAGQHTIVLTSPGGGVAVQGVGTLPVIKTFGHPVIASGDIPDQNTSGGLTTPAVVAQYNAYVLADEALLIADGADVRHSPNQQYMHGSPAEMNDQVHPNAAVGQPEIAQAFLQTLQAVPSQAAQIATLHNQVVALQNAIATGSGGSGGTTPVEPTLAGSTIIADWDATRISGVSTGSALTVWNDVSGNSNNLANSGSPVYVANGINSKPAVQLDGSTAALYGTIPSQSSPYSVCAVMQIPSLPSAYSVLASFGPGYGSGNPDANAYFSSTGMSIYNSSIANLTNSVPANTPFVGCWVFNGASSYVAINGTSVSTASVGTNPSSTEITIGYDVNVGYYSGYIGRAMFLSGALSPTDLQAVTTNMRNEFSF